METTENPSIKKIESLWLNTYTTQCNNNMIENIL